MSSRAEVLSDGAIRRKKSLGLSSGLKPLHTPLSLTRRLMRVFRPIIKVSMLAVFHTRHELSLGSFVTFQFIGDEHPWGVRQSLEQPTEERLCGFLVAPALHQDIEHSPVLIHGPPEVMTLTVNREKHLVEVPLITRPGPLMPEFIRIGLAELAAPLPDGFIGHDHPTGEQELFDIAVAETEAEIQSDAMADDLGREAVAFVRVGWCGGVHRSSQDGLSV